MRKYGKLRRYDVHLGESQIQKLQEISDETGILVSELIRRAIGKLIEEREEKSGRPHTKRD